MIKILLNNNSKKSKAIKKFQFNGGKIFMNYFNILDNNFISLSGNNLTKILDYINIKFMKKKFNKLDFDIIEKKFFETGYISFKLSNTSFIEITNHVKDIINYKDIYKLLKSSQKKYNDINHLNNLFIKHINFFHFFDIFKGKKDINTINLYNLPSLYNHFYYNDFTNFINYYFLFFNDLFFSKSNNILVSANYGTKKLPIFLNINKFFKNKNYYFYFFNIVFTKDDISYNLSNFLVVYNKKEKQILQIIHNSNYNNLENVTNSYNINGFTFIKYLRNIYYNGKFLNNEMIKIII